MAAFDEARAAAEAIELIYPPSEISDVALCGMGGSAIAADLVLGAYRERLQATDERGARLLPARVDRRAHAGDPELVLGWHGGDAHRDLPGPRPQLPHRGRHQRRQAGHALPAEEGVPVVPVVPGFQPRAALLRMLVPLVVLLGRLEVLPPMAADLDEARETIAHVDRHPRPRRARRPQNPAKQLARALQGAIPLVWGGELTAPGRRALEGAVQRERQDPGLRLDAARAGPQRDLRFRRHAARVQYPGRPDHAARRAPAPSGAAPLRPHPRTGRVARRQVVSITADGQGALARALDLVLLGDYVSLYLALLNEVDPGPVEMIERLKGRLAATGYGRAPAPES